MAYSPDFSDTTAEIEQMHRRVVDWASARGISASTHKTGMRFVVDETGDAVLWSYPAPDGRGLELDLTIVPMDGRLTIRDMLMRLGKQIVIETAADWPSPQLRWHFIKEHFDDVLDRILPYYAAYFMPRSRLFGGEYSDLDAMTIARRRREQALLRDELLRRFERSCALCGERYPANLLVAAHIKKRAYCTPRERMDINVAMLACRMGCDALFEEGYVGIDNNLHLVVAGGNATRSRALSRRLEELRGRKIAIGAASAPYVAWHLSTVFAGE